MKNTLVRKFQLPTAKEPSAESATGKAAVTPPSVPEDRTTKTDFDIPEINTNFMDNLFTDPTFVDRFDVSFGQTVPMGLEAETGKSSTRAGAPDPAHDWPDMLDISFTKPKPE